VRSYFLFDRDDFINFSSDLSSSSLPAMPSFFDAAFIFNKVASFLSLSYKRWNGITNINVVSFMMLVVRCRQTCIHHRYKQTKILMLFLTWTYRSSARSRCVFIASTSGSGYSFNAVSISSRSLTVKGIGMIGSPNEFYIHISMK